MNVFGLIIAIWVALWSYPIVESLVGALFVWMGVEMNAHKTVVHYITSLF